MSKRALVAAIAALLLTTGAGAARFLLRMRAAHAAAPAAATPLAVLPDPARPRGGRPLAVVVAGVDGTEITDLVPPHAILVESGAFDVVVVAPERRAVPLVSGLLVDAGVDLVPDISFEEYDRTIGRAPDLVVVPYIPRRAGADRAIVPWLRTHVRDETMLLTICAGSELAAEAGLLDGHVATTHPGWVSRMRDAYPAVHWAEGVRFTEHGSIVASGGLSAGVHATLAVVARRIGRAAARELADRIGADPHLLDDPRERAYPTPVAAYVRAAYAPDPPRVAFALAPDVDELTLAAAIDATATSLVGTPVALAREHQAIVTRQGLRLAPRVTRDSAGGVARVVTVGPADDAEAWAREHGIPTTTIEGRGYPAALRAIAITATGADARSAAAALLWPDPPPSVNRSGG